MKNMDKRKLFCFLIFTLIIVLLINFNVVFAATSSKIAFCEYGGVRRTFKILGIVLNLIKIIIPLIIIFVAMVNFFKIILSGKTDDLKSSIMQVVKNCVAGLIVFMLPGVINFAINELVGYDDSNFTACTNCLLDADSCKIPESDPETYTDD